MPGLELEEVSHRYEDTLAVDGVNLAVESGELVCLLGPSGCGKSTLLRLAAGLEHLQAGRITISGREVARGGSARQTAPEKRGVGLMFQDFALFPHLTVLDNVRFGLARHDAVRSAWVERALEDVGLAHLADRYPHTLSGGQQQRIALLRALAPAPRVVLLDEPFSGLDEHLRQRVRQETLYLLDRTGVATLMVTHDPDEAMFLADRIVMLKDGRVMQDATPVDTYRHPADPFIARLFGPVNEFAGVVRGGRVPTPLGPIAAPGVADGTRALVLVRAVGIELLAAGEAACGGVTARVRSARPLGPFSQVLLAPGAGAARAEDGVAHMAGHLVEARIPGLSLPEPGIELAVRARPDHTFVFPL